MKKTGKTGGTLPETFKIPWIKSSMILGIIALVIGLAAIFILKILNVGNTQLFLNAKTFVEKYGLVGIFFATMLAGTIVPLGSPAFVVAAASFGSPLIPLILTATAGFTVGMVINYFLACRIGRQYILKKVDAKKLEEINAMWSRWGWIIYTIFGLIPFLPVEVFALLCGLLKAHFATFLALSFAPRLVVFTILAYFGEYIGGWIGII